MHIPFHMRARYDAQRVGGTAGYARGQGTGRKRDGGRIAGYPRVRCTRRKETAGGLQNMPEYKIQGAAETEDGRPLGYCKSTAEY